MVTFWPLISPDFYLLDPQSRVCLGRAQSQEDGDYINANYVRVSGPAVAGARGMGASCV